MNKLTEIYNQLLDHITLRKHHRDYYHAYYSKAFSDNIKGAIEDGNLVVHRVQYLNISNANVEGSLILICENGNVTNNLLKGSLTAIGRDVFLPLVENNTVLAIPTSEEQS